MFKNLPTDASKFSSWPWEVYQPFFAALLEQSLSAENILEWLADWSALDSRVSETYWRLYVMVSINTEDVDAERRYQTFLDGVYQKSMESDQVLKEKLLASGLEPADFEIPLRNMRAEAELFRIDNMALLAAEIRLGSSYDKIIGAQTVAWQGQELTLQQITPLLQGLDREQRERLWRVSASRELDDRVKLSALWAELMDLRRQLAANAGYSNYRDFRWKQLLRFDYTPDDCLLFHDSIEEVVVPAVKRIYERRCQRLGLSSLRPWDLEVDALGRSPLRPYQDIADLEDKAQTIFTHVDPQLGNYFAIMRREGLLDLKNRKGKAPGGYCVDFPVVRRPFIFLNSVGIHGDLEGLFHEGGHAFHVFESAYLPYLAQLKVGMEFAEVASMGMEMLALPYLARDKGGIYSTQDAARAYIEHLENALIFWPYMAIVDSFQHWVYNHHQEAMDGAACDKKWGELWQRFIPGQDWSGLEEEMKTGWQRKLHIYQLPFYYIEYGMAQLGAMQVWANALQDQTGAIAAYRQALALGGTRSLSQLFTTAGARFQFDSDSLRQTVDLVEQTIAKLEEV
jgi:oligoendopeptidase F